MLKSKIFILTFLISIFLSANIHAKYSIEDTAIKIPSTQISISNANFKFSNISLESIEVSENTYDNSSEESFENIVFGIFGILVFVVLPLCWKPSRKAIGLMNIIIGTLISLTVIGAVLGIPMIIFGGILFFI